VPLRLVNFQWLVFALIEATVADATARACARRGGSRRVLAAGSPFTEVRQLAPRAAHSARRCAPPSGSLPGWLARRPCKPQRGRHGVGGQAPFGTPAQSIARVRSLAHMRITMLDTRVGWTARRPVTRARRAARRATRA